MLPNYFLNSPYMVRESEFSDDERENNLFNSSKNKMDIEEFFINKKIEKIVKTENNLNEKLMEDIFDEEKKKVKSEIFSEVEDEFFENIDQTKYNNNIINFDSNRFTSKKDLFQDILLPKKTENIFQQNQKFKNQKYENLNIFSNFKNNQNNDNLNFSSNQNLSPNQNYNYENKNFLSNEKIQKLQNYDNNQFSTQEKFQNYKNTQFSPKNAKRISFSTDESINRAESCKETDCGCKCKNSNCLRLHCSCFKVLGYCGKNCKCRNCLNIHKYKKAREFVIQKTKFINKMAFKEKTTIIKNINGSKIVLDGCNCSKGCKNNYCGCKKVGGKCSPICRCNECQNSKVFLSREEIQQIYKPYSRKKHKLVINFENSVQDKKDQNIKFEIYKK